MADDRTAPQAREIQSRVVVHKSPVDEEILTHITPPAPAVGVKGLCVNESSCCVTADGLRAARIIAVVNFTLSYVTADGVHRNIDDAANRDFEFPLTGADWLRTAPEPAARGYLLQGNISASRYFLAGDSSGRIGCIFNIRGQLEVTAIARLRVLTVPLRHK